MNYEFANSIPNMVDPYGMQICPPGWTHTGGIQRMCWPFSADENGNLVPFISGHNIQSGNPYDAAYAWQVYRDGAPLAIEELEANAIESDISIGNLLIAGGVSIGAVGTAVFGGAAISAFAATPIGQATIGGGIVGGIGATVYADWLYAQAVSGACGCEMQIQMLTVSRGDFVNAATGEGIKGGALFGGLGSIGAVGRFIAGIAGAALGGDAVFRAGQDIVSSGLNPCNAVRGILGAIGVVGGLRAVRSNLGAITQTGRYPVLGILPNASSTGQTNNFIIVGTPSGQSVAVPSHWIRRIANNGRGIVFQRPGSLRDADSIRIMDANAQYPNGYLVYYNSNNQPVNPLTGGPGTRNVTHIAFPYFGPLLGWPTR